MISHNYLMDNEFLSTLDANRERETYVRIIALSHLEEPIEQIEGRITQGTINIDGASAVRRTCSLSLVAQDLDINDYYWGIKNKFKLEIGLANSIKDICCNEASGERWGDRYPQDIIWFPQGIFAITSFNTSYNISGYNISISGKDKMCFLNGELGGSLTSSIDFGVLEEYDNETKTTTYTQLPIEKIIRELLHTYAQEPYHNIIINDLDEAAIELLEYRGDENNPLYLLYEVGIEQFTNFTVNGKQRGYGVDYIDNKYIYNGKIYQFNNEDENLEKLIYNERIGNKGTLIVLNISNLTVGQEINDLILNKVYTVAKITGGDAVGYRITDLTYAGDLISNIGESITSILDKVKNMLGEYEYFYDVQGRFIFQKKKNYINSSYTSLTSTDNDEEYAVDAMLSSPYCYRFEGNNLITSFSNSPNLTNLKNDYSIWGERTSASGVKIPIHYRYAIDIKPTKYNTIGLTEEQYDEFKEDNPKSTLTLAEAKKSEQYNDAEYDWRELIYQMAKDQYRYGQYEWYASALQYYNPEYIAGITGYEQYYTDILGFWRELYNPEGQEDEDKRWNELKYKSPELLNFGFDFLDANSELGQFSVKMVGDRVKAVNDKAITAISFKEIPNLIFTTKNQMDELGLAHKSGYTPVIISGQLENLFTISAQGKSAIDLLDEMLYNYSYCVESATIQTIPIYHLSPNTRIYVQDDKSKIDGEYIINRISIPLSYNGTMSITANKAPERIY